ncbi:dihydropteroate synthase [Glaciecola sp. MH2013]|uniref:dihydropteroate synthase n=1 Tax=Glaciecola sp. MH2013 TaxID=2785524 RepID=UPI00189D508C|nr:dihydropteroate synthase [Glaciecola sp. MH2013]MBF7072636.1 dihydropteroate synthase [Glaciecola sp. MH2013]
MIFKTREVSFDSPQVMGILNVTPDSFSDGGKFAQIERAISQAHKMVNAGASFIDIGGESTRPGATPVSLQEELDRVIPVIEKISTDVDAVISIDTYKAQVMTEAVKAGATMINDVKALRDQGALDAAVWAAKTHSVPTCIMHMRGSPESMQDSPECNDIVEDVIHFFEQRIKECVNAGILYSQLIIDPGFGFGKTLEQNYQLLKHISDFSQFDLPVLSGTSRKSMIGNLLNKEVGDRLAGSISTATIAALSGASIIRVHDVEETSDAVKIVNKLQMVE